MTVGVLRWSGFGWFAVWLFIVVGAMMGTTVGYNAATPADTQLSYDGSYLTIGEEHIEMSLEYEDKPVPDHYGVLGVQGAYVASEAVSMEAANQMLTIAMHISVTIADAYATFIFYNKGWLPVWLVTSYILMTAVSVPGLVFWYKYKHLVKRVTNR